MASRADWDYDDDDDDDFEILSKTLPSQNKYEFIEDDTFEIVSSKKKPSLSINTNNPIPHVTIIEEPVLPSINTDKPIVNEVKQSVENTSCLPIRYGSAAIIPHNEGFDLKSILSRKSSIPIQTNDLKHILQNDKPRKPLLKDNHLQQILLDNHDDRRNLVQIAKQAQQDFLNAIQLD